MRHPVSQRAFTLIELMLAISIALVIFGLAIPSMRGMSAQRRLQETFEKFDELTRKAQLKAVRTQQTSTLVWQAGMISLKSSDTASGDRQGAPVQQEDFTYDENESYALQRPASLLPVKDTPPVWTFWHSGTCEPVIVSYSGPSGTWTAQYNPLTGRGEVTDMEVK